MKRTGKLLSVILALALCLGLLPLALAADGDFTIDHVLSEYHGSGGDVVIPDGVTVIGFEAFKGCGTMTSVTIPVSVTAIREAAFADCGSLTDVYYLGSTEDWGNIDIREGNTSLAAAKLHCGDSDEGPGGSESDTPATRFTDVPNWCAEAVNWAVSNGIANGTSETTFSPDNTLTRGEIVTLLYRAVGSPKITIDDNPFTDVPAWCVTPVLWAYENGIANGTSPTTFNPGGTCTRGEFVALLYRTQGSPAVNTDDNPFTDVPEWFVAPVLWAVANGVARGTSETTFSTNDTMTRGEVIVLLHSFFA